MDKWDPVKDAFSLRERINKLFEDSRAMAGETKCPVWRPTVDIFETPAEFVVKAELPEVAESDIDISVEGNILKVRGERRLNREGRNYHQVERPYGIFSRSVVLPETVGTNLRADLNDGILKIILPKRVHKEPRHIEIE